MESLEKEFAKLVEEREEEDIAWEASLNDFKKGLDAQSTQ